MKHVLFLLFSGACAPRATPTTPAEAAVAADATPAARADDAAILPRPFTAEQIRDAMPVGTHIRFAIEEAGAPSTVQDWVVSAADAETCTIASRVESPDGALLEDEGAGTDTWVALMEHATFPVTGGSKIESKAEVPAGVFETWLYTVRAEADGVVTERRFHFSPSLPGPPVLMEVEVAGQPVYRMALLSRASEGVAGAP